MRQRYIVGAAFVLLLAAFAYFYAGSRVPAGQPPLRRLSTRDAAAFKNEFNASKDYVRVVILLSPT